jgi:hypothetical protein
MEALPQIYNRFPFQIPLKNTFLYPVQNPKIAAQGATHVCHHPEEGKARAGCWEERARAASDGRRHSAGSRHPRRRVRPRAARARRQGRNEKPWGGGGHRRFAPGWGAACAARSTRRGIMECRRISSGSDAALTGASSAAADAAAALAAVAAGAPVLAKSEQWVPSYENRRSSAEALQMTQENCNW